jgi:pimeloyl-ACP methyl ester carboxylesterase
LDGNCVEFVRQGERSPTVVFESGLGATLEWWTKVMPLVTKHTGAIAYNRPGYGKSPQTAECRDGDYIVGYLRRFLTALDIKPPFLLVGHSLGGLYAQLFARKYPEEVAGLVLVESTHPEQLIGAGAQENWPTWFRVMFDAAFSEVTKAELACTTRTGQALMALPTFRGPVWVLTATGPMGQEGTELARDANTKRRDIACLNPGAKQIWVEGSHAIPLEQPETISNAVLEILALLGRDPVRLDV